MQFRPVTSRGPFPIDRKWAGGRSADPICRIRTLSFPGCQASTNDRGHATDGSSATFTRNRGPCRGSRTARGRASIRRPGRRGTPGWTTRAGAARACPRRHRTTPEIERGGRRPTRSASPRAVERTRDTDSGSPRRPSGRRLARRDLRCRCCPDRGLSEDSVERQVEERPAGAERRRGQVHRRPTCGSICPTSITVPAYSVTRARIGGWSKLLQAARAPSETAVPGRRGRRRASR